MPKLVINYRDLKSILARRDLKSELSNRLLTAEAVLDPDTLNRYFRSGHEATMTDLYTSAFSKLADTDTLVLSDSPQNLLARIRRTHSLSEILRVWLCSSTHLC